MDIGVRLATVDDAEAVRAIYNDAVLRSTVTFDLRPRSIDEQRQWLLDRSGVHPAVVAYQDGVVIGFGALSPYRDRPAYVTTVEDSVYVHADHRGKGVGQLLLRELVTLARGHGFHAVIARIVGGHEASIRLHRSVGFELVGTEREVGRKFRLWLDVVVMQLLLAPPSATDLPPVIG